MKRKAIPDSCEDMPRKTSRIEKAITNAESEGEEEEEVIDHDDLCPICQLLLYRPVRTRCNHRLCESCMAQWADVSITNQMTTVDLDDEEHAISFLPHEIETKCPMCRTLTTAVFDPEVESRLKELYPSSYQIRKDEQDRSQGDDGDGDPASSIETLTVYIGNEHELIRAENESNNRHSWKFFVRPSRTDVIEEVQVFLVGSFCGPTERHHHITWVTG
jgi:hypothetical protein